MAIDNDTRGWIMTALSGFACLLGAGFICIDLVVRRFPGQQNFNIQSSNGFLSCSLSLSSGVMLFSSLYKMLPSASRSLAIDGKSKQRAAWLLIGLFLTGAMGIQILSRVMHHFLPSHVVDCDHTHDDHDSVSEIEDCDDYEHSASVRAVQSHDITLDKSMTSQRTFSSWKRWLHTSQKSCPDDDDCHGFSKPCGDCFKNQKAREHSQGPSRSHITSSLSDLPTEGTSLLPLHHQEANGEMFTSSSSSTRSYPHSTHRKTSRHSHEPGSESIHHHHVPTNAFLSLGLQTSFAIALHKIPEGFITFASNHASPSLGLAVFMSLFIHNITEGFALALPLYLAFKSRPKAITISAILGGVSQPVGAGIAALWFDVWGGRDNDEEQFLFGVMFALVSGIMTSVGLQLLGESLQLGHNRDLCLFFVFLGMGVLGVANALTII